jgi:hypothetical protein
VKTVLVSGYIDHDLNVTGDSACERKVVLRIQPTVVSTAKLVEWA